MAYDIDEYEDMIRELRGMQYDERTCVECSGTGVKAYGDTTTWHGGIGGQAITYDVCDNCWGSGSAEKSWTSLRSVSKMVAALTVIANNEPLASDEFDTHCVYCYNGDGRNYRKPGELAHNADCPWVLACEALGMSVNKK